MLLETPAVLLLLLLLLVILSFVSNELIDGFLLANETTDCLSDWGWKNLSIPPPDTTAD